MLKEITREKSKSKLIRNALDNLESSVELSFLSLRKQIILRNWLALAAASLAAWYFEEQCADPSYSTLTIRVLVCVLGLPLVLLFHSIKAGKTVRREKAYLLVFFTLLLPFMFGLIGLLNAMHTPEGGELSPIWIFQYMAALFIFYGLLSKDYQTLFICAGSHLVALMVAVAISPVNFEAAIDFSLGMISAQLTMFAFATLTHRRLQFVNQQKIEAAYAIGSKVAHEVRTPLLTIKHLTQGADRTLTSAQTLEEFLSAKNEIKNQLVSIRNELNYANKTIDMLLVSSSTAPFSYDKNEVTEIGDCIDEAIKSYPYANRLERSRITLGKAQDYSVIAPRILIHHVVLNLIRNAILSAEAGKKPIIQIEYGINNGCGEISVRDNGVGIPKDIEAKIFDEFFTTRTTGDGTGLGLAFSKSVMLEIGGDIRFESTQGYTNFVLMFPETKTKDAPKTV